MNANQNKNQSKIKTEFNPSLIQLEKAKPISLFKRMKMAFSQSDLDLQSWEQLESKRMRLNSSREEGNH